MVFSPHKKPVAMNNRVVSERSPSILESPRNKPIKKPPIKLEANVPNGKEGSILLKSNPNHHLKRAPVEAPIEIKRMFRRLMKRSSPLLGKEYQRSDRTGQEAVLLSPKVEDRG